MRKSVKQRGGRMFMAMGILLLFGAMLFYPQIVVSGAAEGLLLWYRTVLPTLLPFLIMSQILISSNLVYVIGKLLYPVMGPVFHISESAAFAVFGGFLCGYPVGAKLAFDLEDAGAIAPLEGSYLLSFCNNASPMFVISFIFLQKLRRPDLALPSIGILWGSTVVCSMIFRRLFQNENEKNSGAIAEIRGNRKQTKKSFHMSPQILDDAITDGCATMIQIGGYLMVFSILMKLLQKIPLKNFVWSMLFLPSMEITGGIELLTGTECSFILKYVLLMALTAFGGMCAAFQTRCVAGKHPFSMGRYIIEKLITAVVTSLLAYFFMKLYYG